MPSSLDAGKGVHLGLQHILCHLCSPQKGEALSSCSVKSMGRKKIKWMNEYCHVSGYWDKQPESQCKSAEIISDVSDDLYVWVRRETNLEKFVTKVPFSNELDSRSLIRYSPFPRESDRGLSVCLCNPGINIDIGSLSLLRNFPLHFFQTEYLVGNRAHQLE